MAAKSLVFSLLVAAAYGSGGFSSFSYGVSDPRTGDVKDQYEKRDGGHVVGQYSLLEADGTKRVVEYQADDATGFKAIVHKQPAGGLAGAHSAHLAGAGLGLGGGAPLVTSHFSQTTHAGGLTNHHHANSVYPSYATNTAGYSSPAARPLGAHGAPAVSSYSHKIVHDVSRPYAGPYAGAFGGYGAHGALASNLGHGPLATGANGWAPAGANAWPSPSASVWPSASANAWPSALNTGVNGWSAPLAKGTNGWPSPAATVNGWSSSYGKGASGWSSPASATGLGANLLW